jgi:hypothetical protein
MYSRLADTLSPRLKNEVRAMIRIVFWDVLPCKMIVDRRFRGAYCLHHSTSQKNSDHTRRRENLKSHKVRASSYLLSVRFVFPNSQQYDLNFMFVEMYFILCRV